MKIGIDVESGERPFEEHVKGILTSIKIFPEIKYFIIGNSEKIKVAFPKILKYSNVTFIDSQEVIGMDEEPIKALQKKKKSTIAVGIELLKDKIIDFFFSPGNTGAIVVASILKLGMIEGIKRPAMATFLPRVGGGETLILDIGANPDSNEINLFQNAILGLSYYKLVWKKEDPSIGLLNMGGESIKGSNVIKKAFNNIKQNIPSFIGNVEGYNVFNGNVDIVVCNGFTGNSILKIAEALKIYFISTFRQVFLYSKTDNYFKKLITYFLSIFGFFSDKKKRLSKSILPKFYGAAPLLGVNGNVLVGHGACKSRDLVNAIEMAYELFKLNYLKEITGNIKKLLKND